MTEDHIKEQTQGVALLMAALVMVLALCLRYYQLDRALGGGDENAMLLYFGYAPLKYIATTYFDTNNHIFHTLLVHLMALVFGENSAVAIRFPTLLFGLATLWVVYLIALQLFRSTRVALISLLLIAVNPVHIHYSQTARGYSLAIFFSSLMILATLKCFESKTPARWGAILVLCGGLSLYTLPTQVYFLMGLLSWILAVLFVPCWAEEYGLDKTQRNAKFRLFLYVGGGIVLLSLIAYAPILSQIDATIQNHQLMNIESENHSMSSLIPGIFRIIFQGPMIWFTVFLLVGICCADTRHPVDRMLPVFIFCIPLVIAWATGMAGYPRNHLYSLPLIAVFLAKGILATGTWTVRLLKNNRAGQWVAGVSCTLFVLASLKVVLLDYYPAGRVASGIDYQEKVLQHSKPSDLIVIDQPKNYLYARSVYKQNILNILSENKLSGVQLVAENQFDVNHVRPESNFTPLKIINQRMGPIPFETHDVSGNKQIVRLTATPSVSLLPTEFELASGWEIVQGTGSHTTTADHQILGQRSMLIESAPTEHVVLRSPTVGPVAINKPSLAVLIWARKIEGAAQIVSHPLLTVVGQQNNTVQYMKIPMAKINNGINVQFKDNVQGYFKDYWTLNSSFGILPPGNYSFALWFKSGPGNSVYYGGLRLFLAELPEPGEITPLKTGY